jgi:hypothetical protein
LTWARCDCGCGWSGEDEVTQFLIEEAVTLRWQATEQRAQMEALEESRQPTPEEEAEARHQRLVEIAQRQIEKTRRRR